MTTPFFMLMFIPSINEQSTSTRVQEHVHRHVCGGDIVSHNSMCLSSPKMNHHILLFVDVLSFCTYTARYILFVVFVVVVIVVRLKEDCTRAGSTQSKGSAFLLYHAATAPPSAATIWLNHSMALVAVLGSDRIAAYISADEG